MRGAMGWRAKAKERARSLRKANRNAIKAGERIKELKAENERLVSQVDALVAELAAAHAVPTADPAPSQEEK